MVKHKKISISNSGYVRNREKLQITNFGSVSNDGESFFENSVSPSWYEIPLLRLFHFYTSRNIRKPEISKIIKLTHVSAMDDSSSLFNRWRTLSFSRGKSNLVFLHFPLKRAIFSDPGNFGGKIILGIALPLCKPSVPAPSPSLVHSLSSSCLQNQDIELYQAEIGVRECGREKAPLTPL